MRTPDEIAQHYSIEKELADRLRRSSKEERRRLYALVYDELFERVPHHPQLLQKADTEASTRAASQRMRLLGRFLTPETTFLELGAGDCRLALEVAKLVRRVYAIEVSREIGKDLTPPPNFELVISDGTSIPVPEGSITLAYSNQLMEHLHPDDALEQLYNINRSLVRGGAYVCVTPNRVAGPHDVSRYFDDVATGLHMKEYTAGELASLFRRAGFSQISTYGGGQGVYFRSSPLLIGMCEAVLSAAPPSLRKILTGVAPLRALLGVIIVGRKWE